MRKPKTKTNTELLDLARSVQSLADIVARMSRGEPDMRLEALSVRDHLWIIERKLIGDSVSRREWGTHLRTLESVLDMRRTPTPIKHSQVRV